jgi:hypothetical protein
LFEKIKTVKREKNRIARDNSEDAVTWNVFRFLESNNLVDSALSPIIGACLTSSEVMYWSFSQRENSSWSELNKARREFGEERRRSTEPDIIIRSRDALLFIEAKLTAGNETVPSDTSNSKKYETGGDNWFSKVFNSDYNTVAIVEKMYQLLRLWLLGSWVAKQRDLDFHLVNLVLSEREKDIEAALGRHLCENQRMKFTRITWEDIYQQILNSGSPGIDEMTRYFRSKTIGYDGRGKLQRAFSIP